VPSGPGRRGHASLPNLHREIGHRRNHHSRSAASVANLHPDILRFSGPRKSKTRLRLARIMEQQDPVVLKVALAPKAKLLLKTKARGGREIKTLKVPVSASILRSPRDGMLRPRAVRDRMDKSRAGPGFENLHHFDHSRRRDRGRRLTRDGWCASECQRHTRIFDAKPAVARRQRL